MIGGIILGESLGGLGILGGQLLAVTTKLYYGSTLIIIKGKVSLLLRIETWHSKIRVKSLIREEREVVLLCLTYHQGA